MRLAERLAGEGRGGEGVGVTTGRKCGGGGGVIIISVLGHDRQTE